MVKVATCWDDGVITDLRLIDIFRKYNAKATFNLCPGFLKDRRVPSRWLPFEEMRDCAKSYSGFQVGHISLQDIPEIYKDFQVASHCWNHETAGTMPDAAFLKAALDDRHYLEDVMQQPCTGFAWPNGQATQSTADAMLEAGFAYGRTVVPTENVLGFTHPMMLGPTCHHMDRDFIRKFEKAKAENGVFYFWGHSYELMDCDRLWNFLEQKIRYISEDPETEWIDVVDIPALKKASL